MRRIDAILISVAPIGGATVILVLGLLGCFCGVNRNEQSWGRKYLAFFLSESFIRRSYSAVNVTGFFVHSHVSRRLKVFPFTRHLILGWNPLAPYTPQRVPTRLEPSDTPFRREGRGHVHFDRKCNRNGYCSCVRVREQCRWQSKSFLCLLDMF